MVLTMPDSALGLCAARYTTLILSRQKTLITTCLR